MGVKQDNKMMFYGEGYGYVTLVKRSVSYRYHHGHWRNPFTGIIELSQFNYWRGQLVHRWEGKNDATGEEWGPYSRGRIVWLKADIFKEVAIKTPGKDQGLK